MKKNAQRGQGRGTSQVKTRNHQTIKTSKQEAVRRVYMTKRLRHTMNKARRWSAGVAAFGLTFPPEKHLHPEHHPFATTYFTFFKAHLSHFSRAIFMLYSILIEGYTKKSLQPMTRERFPASPSPSPSYTPSIIPTRFRSNARAAWEVTIKNARILFVSHAFTEMYFKGCFAS